MQPTHRVAIVEHIAIDSHARKDRGGVGFDQLCTHLLEIGFGHIGLNGQFAQLLRVALLCAETLNGLLAEHLLVHIERIVCQAQHVVAVSGILAATHLQCATHHTGDRVVVRKFELVIVAAEGHLGIVLTQQVGDLLAVRDVVDQGVVADADNFVSGAGVAHRLLDPEYILGADRTLGHFHIGTNLITNEEVVTHAHRHATLFVEQTTVGHKCALGPRCFVVAGSYHQGLIEFRNDLVYQLQLGVATHITKVARDDNKVVGE